jgi:predicted ATPase
MIAVIESFSSGGMRGRENEQRRILDLLQRVARGGSGGVVLAEGEPGIGKTALMRRAVDGATILGLSLAAGAGDQVGRAIPLFALRAALGEPFARFTAEDVDRDARGGHAWWIGRMRAHLEERAAAQPVLVCLDDVQWTCPATLAGLRTLSRALKRRPVAWVLARSWSAEPDAEDLFDVLEQDGALRLDLAPLTDDAVAALLGDAFGAPPEARLTALAAEAAGNPSLLAELIAGLRDDDAVRCADGRAGLTSGLLPRRVHRVARARLDRLSQPARLLLMTAAVLGPSFRLEDAAAMSGESPAALLSVIEETTAAGITTAVEDVFRFRHQLLRRAVHDMIPRAGRTALYGQYGRLLLGDRTADGRA